VSARGLQSQYSGVAGGSRAEKLNYAEAEVGDGKAQVTCTTPDLIIIAPATPTQFAFEETERSVRRQFWPDDRQYSIPLSNSADLPVS